MHTDVVDVEQLVRSAFFDIRWVKTFVPGRQWGSLYTCSVLTDFEDGSER